MSHRFRLTVATVAAAGLVLSGAGAAVAHDAGRDDHRHPGGPATVYTLDPSTHGNPEGVAWDGKSKSFFVGTVGDGTIYRGTLGNTTVTPFVAGAGAAAVGMKVSRGTLFVAGGPSQTVRAYDVSTGALKATFSVPGSGFLNDLVVTRHGDVYVTDSFVPTLWKITAAQVAAGAGTATGIPVGPEIPYAAGAFNLNGIVDLKGGKQLVVVDSNTGNLFRIDFKKHAAGGRTITRIAGATVPGGDGMIVDRGRLVVVAGSPAALHFLKLRRHNSQAREVAMRTDPTLHGPSTIARAGHTYLVVNADFATSTTPFTVSGLPR